jgi:ADP-ribose pyrophosphatase YjhB (NUDIX family)
MDDEGQPVKLTHPSLASDSSTWSHASHIATVTPDGPLPERINHLAIESWVNAPTNANGWEQLANASNFIEPPMRSVSGKPPASGAVVVESDGRVWVVSPSNGFGGYTHTFPKGKLVLKGDLGLRANALKEVFEETGLQVELTGFLCDAIRSTSVTRFYLAMRVGGNPAAMGWESQATHLVPMEQLAGFVSHANDKIVVQSLRERPRLSRSDIVSYEWGLTSVHRILATVADFRWQYGQWPKRLLMDRGMVEVIPKDILTPLGWQMLNLKLEIVAIDDGTLFAEGAVGERCEYGDHFHLQEGPSVTFWIWGIELLER